MQSPEATSPWLVKRARGQDGELRFFHRDAAGRFRQCAALHDNSGYFRLAPGTDWGTSIVLPPTLWTQGRLHQGTPLLTTWRIQRDNLVLEAICQIAALKTFLRIVLKPPQEGYIEARVRASCEGDISLDARPGEAFKPVMLSSMRISSTQWDAANFLLDGKANDFDDKSRRSGWIVTPERGICVRSFGLGGGASDWKTKAPTTEIRFAQPVPIAGWRTHSDNPNDDNLALWAASDHVLRAWNYTIVASRAIE